MRMNQPSAAARPDTETYEGAPAFSLAAKDELATIVASSLFGEDTFYESGDDRRARIDNLVSACDPEFVAKLAVYSRSVWQLRTVSLYLVLALAAAIRKRNAAASMSPPDRDLVRSACRDVIQRADEIREVMAGAITVFGGKKKIPYSIRKGIALAMHKFDQYGFAKYQGGSGAVTFKDVLRVIHPEPRDEVQSAVFAQIMAGTLSMPEGTETWERIISSRGSSTETWSEAREHMPYMALLRNLRNLHIHGAIDESVINRIRDPKAVAKSRQLPVRFLSAARELEAAGAGSRVAMAVMEAAEHSISHLPKLGDRVLICVDVSGSMSHKPISAKSTLYPMDIAAMMGASLALATVRAGGEADLFAFATGVRRIPIVERDLLIRIAGDLVSKRPGEDTRLHGVWRAVAGRSFDAIVVFSDMQVAGTANCDERNAPPAPLKISYDLQGYGKTPFVQRGGWNLLAGWSDKALQALAVIGDQKGIARVVENWQWPAA